MKKFLFILILSAALLLCSGCNSEEPDKELEEMINSLKTVQLGGGESGEPGEKEPIYKSFTGTVSGVAKKNITVKTDDQQYKVATDGDPQIFGGALEKGLTVTVTYLDYGEEVKVITPTTITILDGKPAETVPAEETSPDETTVSPDETGAETVTDDTAAGGTEDPQAQTTGEETTVGADATTIAETTEDVTAVANTTVADTTAAVTTTRRR